MSAREPYPVGSRLRCTGYTGWRTGSYVGKIAVVSRSHKYGYGVRFEDHDYGDDDDPFDQHDFWNYTWEPVSPKDRPVRGICKFLRKLEEKT